MTVFTAGLQFKKIGLDQQRKQVVICVPCEVVESDLVKLETRCTVKFGKICHFGKVLKDFCQFFMHNFVFGKIQFPNWQIRYASGQIFVVVKGQI